MRRTSATAVALLALAPLWSGCGGAMRPEELRRSIQALESTAADGALLAREVARDSTKATFARAHARELGEDVDHEAEKLNDADANGKVAARKAAAVEVAGAISQALGQIQTAPTSESEGRSAVDALTRMGDRARRLSEGL